MILALSNSVGVSRTFASEQATLIRDGFNMRRFDQRVVKTSHIQISCSLAKVRLTPTLY